MLVKLFENAYLRITVSALAALLAYGAWAYWINTSHGKEIAMRAAITQGSYSFVLTLCLTAIIEWLFTLTSHWRQQTWALSSFTCLCLYISSYVVNAWAGTPEILMTIIPSSLLSTLYTVSYILTLKKLSP